MTRPGIYSRSSALLALLLTFQAHAGEPLELRLTSWPSGARVEVRTSTGRLLRGRTPWRRRLPPGDTGVSLSRKGHRPWKKTLDLRRDTDLNTCLDPNDQLVQCQRIIPCGMRPKAVAISPDGSEVWVTLLFGPPSVQVFDIATGKKLASITPTRHGAVELEISADGERVYVSQMATSQVHEIDRKTYRVLRSFDTQGNWTKVIRLSLDQKTLFASNWISNDVSAIDLSSGQVRQRIRTVAKPRGLYTTGGRQMYVAGFEDGVLQKIDLMTGESKILYDKGTSLRHIVADESRRRLYISDLGERRIYTLDLNTDEVKPFVRTGYKPNTIDLSPDGRILFVSNRGRPNPRDYKLPGPEYGSVQLFDTDSRKVLDVIVGGNQPTGLDVSANGRIMVFSDFLDNRLRIYSIPAYEVLRDGGGGRVKSHLSDLSK